MNSHQMNTKHWFLLQSKELVQITNKPLNKIYFYFILIKSKFRILSAAKDDVKNLIQSETQTTITCSKVKSDGTSKRVVEIKGTSHKNVYTARQKIKSFGCGGTKRKLPTHFTCVKITDFKIKENFLKFKVCIH